MSLYITREPYTEESYRKACQLAHSIFQTTGENTVVVETGQGESTYVEVWREETFVGFSELSENNPDREDDIVSDHYSLAGL